MSTDFYPCPCCGYQQLDAPAYERFVEFPLPSGISPPYKVALGKPSYDVCDCCGYEFGNDDDPGTGKPSSFENYLKEWIDDGAVWFDSSKKPANWILSNQLKNMNPFSNPRANQ